MREVFLDPVAMRGVERIVITIIGAFFGYLGFRLFRLGITHGSATLSGESKWGKLLFSGTAPGLFFMFVGGFIVAVALLTGGGQTTETQRGKNLETRTRLPGDSEAIEDESDTATDTEVDTPAGDTAAATDMPERPSSKETSSVNELKSGRDASESGVPSQPDGAAKFGDPSRSKAKAARASGRQRKAEDKMPSDVTETTITDETEVTRTRTRLRKE